jgi:methylphosphotriester-DNA--protein-cysteine methyltransferase
MMAVMDRPAALNADAAYRALKTHDAGFRPCLRCRPELAPGLAATDSSQALARAGARLIEVDPPAAATPSSRPSTKVDPCIPSCTTP